MKSGKIYDSDIRAFRRWGWLVANEPTMKMEFISGTSNKGADLLSRPHGECYVISVRRIGFGEIFCDLQCCESMGEPVGSCIGGCAAVGKMVQVPGSSLKLVRAHKATFKRVEDDRTPFGERKKKKKEKRERVEGEACE